MAKQKIDYTLDTGLQDGLLAYYLMMAAYSDTNVEARIAKEPFFLRLSDDGHAQHNVRGKKAI